MPKRLIKRNALGNMNKLPDIHIAPERLFTCECGEEVSIDQFRRLGDKRIDFKKCECGAVYIL